MARGAEKVKHGAGFGDGKWSHARACLESFVALYGTSQAQFTLGRLEEAEGHWAEAQRLYSSAADASSPVADAAAREDAIAEIVLQV